MASSVSLIATPPIAGDHRKGVNILEKSIALSSHIIIVMGALNDSLNLK